MTERTETIISDLTCVQPSDGISATPVQDKWVAIPYEGEVSGTMLWSPVRNNPPHLSIPLPDLGLCKVYVGIYASCTVPIWFNIHGARGDTVRMYDRLYLRLSGEEGFEMMNPQSFPEEPRFSNISEMLWKTADVNGQSLVIAPERKEALMDTTIVVAYVRLVPVEEKEEWPVDTKRLFVYHDNMNAGHYVDSAAEIKGQLRHYQDSDVGTVLWTTCREDTCYYPTNVGNRFPTGVMRGVYPYWVGDDMRKMLDAGDDPLKVVCETCHAMDMKVYASYRRMTVRLPPFVFPLHPDGLFMKRPDLRCVDEGGESIPHLSLAFPEVRDRVVSLFREQAENYDIDGVHHFFCRSMPFVYFEPPVLEYCRDTFGVDARELDIHDERLWKSRAHFFLQYCRELRAMLDEVGEKRGKRFDIAMHVINSVRNNAYFGVDVETMCRERLIDVLMPGQGHFIPPAFGEKSCTPDNLRGFIALAQPNGVRVVPAWEERYWDGSMTLAERVRAYYDAGADGLHVGISHNPAHAVKNRRFGHVEELDRIESSVEDAARMVKVWRVGGYTIDFQTGIATVG